eukprot:TRINITY_DN20682_c0_g1_i1.p2 TRINITY_DN20682_c0_g1~~TRINITY_DN20682_c0_g1_i1.p2  ORF type:complete len:160 (-),score=28.48 TRINITY_DN20682_c0_g1_i1:79-558(-)
MEQNQESFLQAYRDLYNKYESLQERVQRLEKEVFGDKAIKLSPILPSASWEESSVLVDTGKQYSPKQQEGPRSGDLPAPRFREESRVPDETKKFAGSISQGHEETKDETKSTKELKTSKSPGRRYAIFGKEQLEQPKKKGSKSVSPTRRNAIFGAEQKK